jgi:hypothetical protein
MQYKLSLTFVSDPFYVQFVRSLCIAFYFGHLCLNHDNWFTSYLSSYFKQYSGPSSQNQISRAILSLNSTIYHGPLKSHSHSNRGLKFSFFIEQMNEGDEAIESTVTRKKKRHSGFRYSSKKVLERSRVKRETTNVGGIQFKSVTKALSYPSEHDCSARSSFPLCLDSVEELDGDGVELSCGNAITFDGCNIKVSNITFPDTCLILGQVIVNSY